MLLKVTDTKSRVFCVFMCAVLLLSVFSVSAFALTDSEKKAYEDKIAAIKSQIEENKNKIKELDEKAAQYDDEVGAYQDKIDVLQSQIDLYNDEIAIIQKDIDGVDAQITAINNEIDALNKQIEELDKQVKAIEAQISDTYKLLGERIRASYMSGANSALEYLLTADNFEYQSYLERVELLKRIAKHDDALIATLQDDISECEKKVEEINGMKEQKASKIAELDEMKKDLEAKKQEQVDARQVIQNSEDEIQAELDKVMSIINGYNADSAAYKAAIERGEDSIRDFEEKIAAAERETGETGSGETGDMIWPLPYSGTYVSSRYGMRTLEGVTKMHNGVDICRSGGTYGAKIVSTKAGTVVTANKSGWGNGYGLYVVVDHGNGVRTYYAHMSVVSVSVGDYVTQGEKLGEAGNTGYSFGAHLHFGMLINGDWVNPLSHVTKPSDLYFNEY